MKTFSVNKNSWHYKLNVRMVKTNERLNRDDYAEKYVRSQDNLCSYWRMTTWSMFKVLVAATFFVVLTAGIIAALYMIGNAFIFHTQQALIATGVIVGIITFIVLVTMLVNWISKRNREKLSAILYLDKTETSLSSAKYSSWKSGICLPVEFKD
jgi:hypothetical protein